MYRVGASARNLCISSTNCAIEINTYYINDWLILKELCRTFILYHILWDCTPLMFSQIVERIGRGCSIDLRSPEWQGMRTVQSLVKSLVASTLGQAGKSNFLKFSFFSDYSANTSLKKKNLVFFNTYPNITKLQRLSFIQKTPRSSAPSSYSFARTLWCNGQSFGFCSICCTILKQAVNRWPVRQCGGLISIKLIGFSPQ